MNVGIIVWHLYMHSFIARLCHMLTMFGIVASLITMSDATTWLQLSQQQHKDCQTWVLCLAHTPSQWEMVWWTESWSGKWNFLGPLPKSGNDQWDFETSNYYVAPSFEYPFFFLSSCQQNVLNVARLHCPEVCLGSPDCFSLWEGGVWGWDYVKLSLGPVISLGIRPCSWRVWYWDYDTGTK